MVYPVGELLSGDVLSQWVGVSDWQSTRCVVANVPKVYPVAKDAMFVSEHHRGQKIGFCRLNGGAEDQNRVGKGGCSE